MLLKEVRELMDLFPNSFINSREELILYTKNNIYFSLGDVTTWETFSKAILGFISLISSGFISSMLSAFVYEDVLGGLE